MTRLMRLLVFATLATGLLVAGCGGDDDDGGGELTAEEYATEVRGVMEPLGEELQALGDVTRESANADELAGNLSDAEDLLAGSVEELEALEPPEEAAGAHDAVVAALADFQAATADFREEVEATDGQVGAEAQQAFQQAAVQLQTDLTDAVSQLQEAGVDLSGAEPTE